VTPHPRLVVVGFGMAGGRLVDELLARPGHAGRITVVGAEPYPAYNRVLLSDVVAGRADVAALGLTDATALRARGVDVRLETHATALDLATGTVHLDDGTRLAFDRLVLATGADPVVPPLAGLAPGGDLPACVHALRTLDDAREIVAACTNARRAVVLGGGLLGLEAARGLARRGLAVEVLHLADHLLPGVLDPAGAAVLARALGRLGVTVRTGARTTSVTRTDDGRLRGVALADGTRIGTDLLVLACGVAPRTALAERAGLAVARGVLVDDTLTTCDPRVLAIGDCAEHAGQVPGLVAPAWEQARVAADLLSGADPGARYRPAPAGPAVRLKAADIEVASVGETAPGPFADEPGLDVVQLLDPARGRYVKAVVRAGTVVGAAVVGDARAAAELRLLVERAAPAPAGLATLLLPGTRRAPERTDDPTAIPDRATVCRCNGVTKGALVRAWSAGARSAADLSRTTRAATGCGSCRDAVDGIAAWLATSDPDGSPTPRPRDQAVRGDRTVRGDQTVRGDRTIRDAHAHPGGTR
jgi:assimilatory nitrate reductase electron transfer subunit